MRKSQIKSCGKTRSMSTSQAREINNNNKLTIHQTKIMLNNHLRCGMVIRCYNVDKEFKFTFISLNMGLKRREGGYHPSDVFDLCSDLILEIHNLVHPILIAPCQMFNFRVCSSVLFSCTSVY